MDRAPEPAPPLGRGDGGQTLRNCCRSRYARHGKAGLGRVARHGKATGTRPDGRSGRNKAGRPRPAHHHGQATAATEARRSKAGLGRLPEPAIRATVGARALAHKSPVSSLRMGAHVPRGGLARPGVPCGPVRAGAIGQHCRGQRTSGGLGRWRRHPGLWGWRGRAARGRAIGLELRHSGFQGSDAGGQVWSIGRARQGAFQAGFQPAHHQPGDAPAAGLSSSSHAGQQFRRCLNGQLGADARQGRPRQVWPWCRRSGPRARRNRGTGTATQLRN